MRWQSGRAERGRGPYGGPPRESGRCMMRDLGYSSSSGNLNPTGRFGRSGEIRWRSVLKIWLNCSSC